MKTYILPSLLAADFGHLEDGARKAETEGGDALHLDIMDGHFVPNLSMGPDVVRMARKSVEIPLSVHLMMTHPDRYLDVFVEAGATSLLIHIEADCDAPTALARIRELGAKPGITLNPETPAKTIFPVLDMVDDVLFMTVHPGYGGQAFMSEVLPEIRMLRDHMAGAGKNGINILVDGGITVESAVACAKAGANAFIAGTSLYRADDMAAEISLMRKKTADALVV